MAHWSRRCGPALLMLASIPPGGAQTLPDQAAPSPPTDDARWTGPLLASSAATLPKAHVYVEPYLFDIRPYAAFDNDGRSHAAPRQDSFGSLTYINYGLTDRLTIGAIPRFGYVHADDGSGSTAPGVGDISVQGQWRLFRPAPGSALPMVSINLQETFPTGRFDRLARVNDGFGSGVHTTALGLYTQSYLRLPTGRPLRLRIDLTYDLAGAATVADRSVYGTSPGFAGRVRPGDSVIGDLGLEYSVTRRWVAAFDLWYQRDGQGALTGSVTSIAGVPSTAVAQTFPAGREWIVAPAVEYNWSARFGVIAGVRAVVAGRNETASIAPVVALSMFY